MNLLPENPKKRQLILIIGCIVTGLFAFGFLYLTYFSPTDSSGQGSAPASGNAKIKAISEDVIKKLEDDVQGIQDELGNDFYKNLKPYPWPKDSASAGNPNLFLIPDGR